MTERGALEVCVKLYMRRVLPHVGSITVDQLGKDVDLSKEPSDEEMVDALAIVINMLGKVVEEGADVDTARRGMFWEVEEFMDKYVRCEEDIHQSDSVIENALEFIEKLYELLQFSRRNNQQ